MEALRFELKGKNAFFKNPEVNSYYYFTYGNIHKPALLGMFGAILGYKGYKRYQKSSEKYEDYPEYYQKLKDIEISVIPKAEKGCFSKKIQFFNNTVGYASFEKGGNLIIKEEWIENPFWIVYVKIQEEESKKLAFMIQQKKCIYLPYLGKNDHPANITNAEIVNIEKKEADNQIINSLVPTGDFIYDWDEMKYKYEEYLPYALNQETNHYELKKFVFTDAIVEEGNNTLYSDGENSIVFY
ncbi:MAG: type I-B CRISPR-associated protein Cas5 [Lachnospiraceae bacterium]|nr:type I-B CRISPR-associated protein Cas5 [Lachnospiraceae bacterium]